MAALLVDSMVYMKVDSLECLKVALSADQMVVMMDVKLVGKKAHCLAVRRAAQKAVHLAAQKAYCSVEMSVFLLVGRLVGSMVEMREKMRVDQKVAWWGVQMAVGSVVYWVAH